VSLFIFVKLNVIKLSIFMLSVIMVRVDILSVVEPFIFLGVFDIKVFWLCRTNKLECWPRKKNFCVGLIVVKKARK
jgi:hypothetical protein